MSYIIKRPWRSQPPQACPINWASSLSRGLKLYVPGNAGNRDILNTSSPALAGNTSISVRSSGRGFYLDGTAGTCLNFGSIAVLKTAPLTWSAKFIFDSLAPQYTSVFAYIATGSYAYYQLLVKSNGKLALYVDAPNAAPSSYDGTGVHTLAANVTYELTLTLSASGAEVYVNGVLDDFISIDASGTYAGNFDVYIGEDTGIAGRQIVGFVNDIKFYDRALNSGEIYRLVALDAKWPLFAPRHIIIPTAAAGGGYTHPTLSNARMGSMTGTGGIPLVDYTF